MSQIALYRKYRPQKFSEVYGQDSVVEALRGALKNARLSHAYLFSGSRGIGKTSLARIFAREVGTTANDLYEIDAASNRGIDDIRALREAVNTLPFDSKYKVYIIDEVHMLTKEAFNALLKTLEEPPAHVLFMLATTEPKKLPETVVSRCQHFALKKPSQRELAKVLSRVAKEEGYELKDGASELLAVFGDGSFRDSLGILQKCFTVSESRELDIETVSRVIGAPSAEIVNEVLRGVSAGDSQRAIFAVKKAMQNGKDAELFYKLVLQKMRAVLLMRAAPETAASIKEEFSEEDFKTLEDLSKDKSSLINSKTLLVFLEMYSFVERAAVPELPLELAVLKVTYDQQPKTSN